MLVDSIGRNCIHNLPLVCDRSRFISRPQDRLYSLSAKPRVCFLTTLFSKWLHFFASLFKPSEKVIDPKLFAYWDQIVEKDYDPEHDPNPAYTVETNASKRGKTLADALIRAVAKGECRHSRFDQVLILTQGRGILFSADGDYSRLASRAKSGEFSAPDTLILLALPHIAIKEEQKVIRQIIDARKRDGFNIENASFFSLTSKEIRSLHREILPKRLAKFLCG